MIEPLIALRQALDAAIAAVQAVEPAVAVWEAAQGAGERAGPAAGTETARNGSATPGGPTGRSARHVQAKAAGAQERVGGVGGTPIASDRLSAPGEPTSQEQSASEDRPAGACVVCGTALSGRPRKGGRPRRYCSSRCRQRATAASRARLAAVPARSGPVAVAARPRPAADANLEPLPSEPERPLRVAEPEDPDVAAVLAASARLPAKWEANP
jgi:hypothetical protein